LIKKVGGDIINKVEVRCKGTYIDNKGNKKPCNHMFFVGSPGFDIYGKPKELVIKCPHCGNYMTITSEIEEKVIVRVLTTAMRIKE